MTGERPELDSGQSGRDLLRRCAPPAGDTAPATAALVDSHDTFTLHAYAKVNLALEVLERTTEGYHALMSVMQTVSLADTLTIAPAPELTLTCSDPALIPDNLVLRAAELLRDRYDIAAGAHIGLHKRIPVAAGLGGGSSDAAAALLGLARLWGIKLSCYQALPLAAELGSDVPFFLYGGTAMVMGRGETVRPRDGRKSWLLLVNPRIAVSTRDVYAELREDEWTQGDDAIRISGELGRGTFTFGRNALQAPLFRLQPEVRVCFERVQSISPRGAAVSGSGATVFAPYGDRADAEAARAALAGTGWWTAVVETTGPTTGSPCTDAFSAEGGIRLLKP